MTRFLKSLCRDARATTTIEYALLCGMIVLAIIGALQGLGGQSGGLWGDISSKTIAASNASAG
jgi:pilus assembly protein Flp/PilA